MNQKFEAAREMLRAREQASEAEADANWADQYTTHVESEGGPEAYFGLLSSHDTLDHLMAAIANEPSD